MRLLADKERGLGTESIQLTEEARLHLSRATNGISAVHSMD